MVNKTKSKVTEIVEEIREEPSPLLDFSKNQSIILRGEFKMKKIWSNKKKKWMFVFEGQHHSIVIGGAGKDGKNVWALKGEVNKNS